MVGIAIGFGQSAGEPLAQKVKKVFGLQGIPRFAPSQ